MIGKQTFGNNFYGCLNYVLSKPNVRLIATNMMTTNSKHLTTEFNFITNQNQRVKYPVCHISLSPHPDDILKDYQTLAMVERCLEEIGMKDCQWILAQHNDTYTPNHQHRPHFHLIVNRVKLTDCKAVNCWRSKKTLEKALRLIENQFNLKSIQSSWECQNSRNFNNKNLSNIMLSTDKKIWHQLRTNLANKYHLPIDFCEAIYQENIIGVSEKLQLIFNKKSLDNQNNKFFWLATKGDINRAVITDNPFEVLTAFLLENDYKNNEPSLYLSLDKKDKLPIHILKNLPKIIINSQDKKFQFRILSQLPHAQLSETKLTSNQLWILKQKKKLLQKQEVNNHQFQLQFLSKYYQKSKSQLQL